MRKILLILFVLLFFISCREERDSDVLNVAISQDVASLDVMKLSSRVLRDILIGSVYEKLFVLDGGEIKNELASSYRLSDDGKYLAIDIRKDVPTANYLNCNVVADSKTQYLYVAVSDEFGENIVSKGNVLVYDCSKDTPVLVQNIENKTSYPVGIYPVSNFYN